MAPPLSQLSLACIASTSFAFAANLGDGPYPGNSSSLPFGIPRNTWNDALSKPNATGQWAFNAPILDGTNGHTANGWAVNISVRADIPLADSTAADVNKSQVTTGTEVAFGPLKPLVDSESSDDVLWEGCFVVGAPGSNVTRPQESKDVAHCSYIPDQCRDRLSDLADEILDDSRNQTFGEFCAKLGTMTVGAECSGYVDWQNKTSFSIDETSGEPGGKFFSYGDAPHDPGNLTVYNSAVKNVWVILSVWRATFSSSNTTIREPPNFTSLECVEPDDITAGSRTPGSAGAALRPSLLGAWISLVAVAIALPLL